MTYRTSAVAHPNVALDVKRRRSGESESFHVSKHLGLEHLALAPRSSETTDQLVVNGATENTKIVKKKSHNGGSVDALQRVNKTKVSDSNRPHCG